MADFVGVDVQERTCAAVGCMNIVASQRRGRPRRFCDNCRPPTYVLRQHDPRDCLSCGVAFHPSDARQVYCSRACRPRPLHVVQAKPKRVCLRCATQDIEPDRWYCPACRRANKRDHRRRQKARLRNARVAEQVSFAAVCERDRWRCQLCRRRVSKTRPYPDPMSPSLDHVVPLADGGTHTMANAQLAHLRCNVAKSDGGTQQLALM